MSVLTGLVFRSGERGGHELQNKRLITSSSVNSWSNNDFKDSWIWGGPLSCMKMVDVRNRLCCSSGTTIVCSVSWYPRPVTERGTGPRAITSWKNGPRGNVTVNSQQTATLGECRGISVNPWNLLSPNASIMCVDYPNELEMSLVALQNIPRPWQINSHSVEKTDWEWETLWHALIQKLLGMVNLV